MELSGQNITIIVVTLAVVALLFYAVHKGRNAKVTSKFGGNEVGVEVGGESSAAAPELGSGAPTAPGLGDISHNVVQEGATVKGPQTIHFGHNVGTAGTPQPPAKRDA